MDKPNGEQIPTTTKEHPDLFKKVVKGGFWVFSLRIFTQILSFARLTILARLLSPDDFGILGIALLVMSILETFSNTGFNAALIQKNKDIRPYLDTAWTLSVIRGFILFGILYAVAPLAAQLKVPEEKIPLVVNVIRVTGIAVMIKGLTNIGTIYFQKELQFHKQFVIGSLTNIVSVTASIAIAIVYRSVWALVLGRLLSNILNCLLSYYMHPYRPRLRFNTEKAKELWGFGRWITANTILGFIMTQGDDIFVWGYLGPTSLAYYQMAYKIAKLPALEASNIISQISFPAFSIIQKNKKRLSNAYFKLLKNTTYFTITAAALLFLFSKSIINITLGEQWISIDYVIKSLIFYGLCCSISSIRSSIFKASNRPDILLRLKTLRIALMVLLILPITKNYRLVGLGCLLSFISFFSGIIALLFLRKVNNYLTIRKNLITILPSLISNALSFTIIFILYNKSYPQTLGLSFTLFISYLCLVGFFLSIFRKLFNLKG